MDNNQFNLFGLFRSRARTILLVNFFINPHKEFYTRGLEKDLKIPASIIHRELKNLEKNRIISSRRLGNGIFYKVDQKSPFYKQLKDLTLKTVGVDKLIQPVLKAEKNIIAGFIYGSYARGDFDASSDIDIFVLAQKNDDLYEKISSKLSNLEEMLGREINMDYFLQEEYNIRKKAKDPYIADLLKNPKIFIKGGEDDL